MIELTPELLVEGLAVILLLLINFGVIRGNRDTKRVGNWAHAVNEMVQASMPTSDGGMTWTATEKEKIIKALKDALAGKSTDPPK